MVRALGTENPKENPRTSPTQNRTIWRDLQIVLSSPGYVPFPETAARDIASHCNLDRPEQGDWPQALRRLRAFLYGHVWRA
jgi:hypothetical protein